MNTVNFLVIIISVVCKVFCDIEVEYIGQRITGNQNGKFKSVQFLYIFSYFLHESTLYRLKLSN